MIADRTATDATMADDGPEGRGRTDDDEERCAYCGTVIDVTDWHPLLSRVENGEVHLYPFCNVDCRDAWLES